MNTMNNQTTATATIDETMLDLANYIIEQTQDRTTLIPNTESYEGFWNDVFFALSEEDRSFLLGFIARMITALKKNATEQTTTEQNMPKEAYLVSGKSVERMDADKAVYEESENGQRFLKKLENAHEFEFKYDYRCDINYSQLHYLANKHHNNLLSGSFDIMALSFKHGYMCGKRAAKKRSKG